MRAAYGDATAQIFLISAVIGVVALVAVLFIKEKPLRRTVDIRPETGNGAAAEPSTAAPTTAAPGPSADVDDLDREFAEVLVRQPNPPHPPHPARTYS
jgi:hypothetical protein